MSICWPFSVVIRLKIPLCEELIKCGKGLRVLLGLLMMCVEDALEAIGVEVEKVAGDYKYRELLKLQRLFYFKRTHLLPQEIVS